MTDRYGLYECCVQSTDDMCRMLQAIHGRSPTILAEDFCGSGALSRQWVRAIPDGRAIATDHDAEPLARVRGADDRILVVHGDVIADTSVQLHRADVVHAGNFSIGEWHARVDLLRYLSHARSRLSEHGILACDLYGGESAFLLGSYERWHPGPDGQMVHYTWEQREADPLTAMVTNAIHFRVGEDSFPDAFLYRWRLWGVAELRDAMIESGFQRTEVFPKVPDAVDGDGAVHVRAVSGDEIDDSFDVLVVGRV